MKFKFAREKLLLINILIFSIDAERFKTDKHLVGVIRYLFGELNRIFKQSQYFLRVNLEFVNAS